MSPSPNNPPTGSGLAVGVLLVTGATYVTYAVGLLSNAIIARGLTPADFGRYSYAIFLCGWLVVVINNGLTSSGIRFVAELRGAGSITSARLTHGYLKRLSHFSELIVLCGFTAVALAVRPIDWRQSMLLYIVVVCLSTFAKSRYLFDVSIAKGYSQFRIEAYSTVGVGLLTAVMIVAAFAAHASLTQYFLVFAVSSVTLWLVAVLQLRRAGIAPQAGKPDEQVMVRLRPHLRWTTVLAGVAVLSNKSVEVFLLNATHGATSVGFFVIGAALTRGGIDLLTSGLTTVLMPVMASAFGRGGEAQVNVIFSDSMRYFAFAGLIAAGVGFCLAAPTVELLYGPIYSPAITAFQVMVLVSGLTLSEASFGALLSTTDRQRSRAGLVLAQIAATILFAAALIPTFGFIGALVAHTSSRLLGFALMFFWVRRTHSATPPFRLLARLLLSACLSGIPAWACVLFVPGMLGYVLGAVVYLCLLAPLTLIARCWTGTDFQLVAGLLERHAPGAPRLRLYTTRLGAHFSAQ